MTLKQWPENGDTLDMDELLDPLRKVLRRGEYEGYELSPRISCMEPHPLAYLVDYYSVRRTTK